MAISHPDGISDTKSEYNVEFWGYPWRRTRSGSGECGFGEVRNRNRTCMVVSADTTVFVVASSRKDDMFGSRDDDGNYSSKN